MDGQQTGLNRREGLRQSLQFRLACAISLAVAAMATIAGVLSFRATLDEVHEFQDEILEQAAELLGPESSPESGPARLILPVGGCLQTDDDEEGLIIQRLPALPDHEGARRGRSRHDPDAHRTEGRTANAGGSARGTPAAATSSKQPEPASRPPDRDDDDDSPRCLPLPATLKHGFHAFRHQKLEYRVYVHRLGDGSRVAVAQETRIRDEIARQSALYATLPLLVLVPVLLLVVLALVRLMLRPLAALSRTLDARREDDLQPLSQQKLPTEIHPFVHAINRLLGRTRTAMESQRRFVADAAHELRSPLAALSLQAERLKAAPMSTEATERLQTLQAGIERGRHLLEQLLVLARAQNARNGRAFSATSSTASSTPPSRTSATVSSEAPSKACPAAHARASTATSSATSGTHPSTTPAAASATTSAVAPDGVAVLDVMRRVLEDLLPLADQKQLNIGISAPAARTDAPAHANVPASSDTPENIRVRMDEMALYTVLRNLVDNAIRYTPAGGQVDLWVMQRGTEAVLTVQDDGPGIPPEERARVIDPFYRVLGTGESGSGLGLSIVSTLVGNAQGTLTLRDAAGALHGLLAEVRLPAA